MSETASSPTPQETVMPQEQRENLARQARKDAETVGKRMVELLASTGKSDSELETEGKGHVILLRDLFRRRKETGNLDPNVPDTFKDPKNKSKEKPVDLSKGEPLIVTFDGNPIQITRLRGTVNRDGVAMGIVEYKGGKGTIEVPMDGLIQGQILSEKERFTQGFEGAEKTVLEYYLGQLGGGDNAAEESLFGNGANIEETRRTVEEAAQKTGMLTGEDVEAFIQSQMPKKEDGTDFTPQEQAQITRLEHIRELVTGKTIIDRETLGLIITNGEQATPESVSQNLEGINQNIEELTRQQEEVRLKLEDESVTGEERTKLEEEQTRLNSALSELQGQKAPLEELQQLLKIAGEKGINGILDEYWNGITSGTISSDKAGTIREGFRSGNLEAVLDSFLAEEPVQAENETAKEFQERKKKLLEIKDLKGKSKTIGIMMLLGLLVVTAEILQKGRM